MRSPSRSPAWYAGVFVLKDLMKMPARLEWPRLAGNASRCGSEGANGIHIEERRASLYCPPIHARSWIFSSFAGFAACFVVEQPAVTIRARHKQNNGFFIRVWLYITV